jgi:hypothetical protein
MMRTLILTHRYVGIATCLLFVMWSGSGWEGRWHTVFADDGSVLDRVEPARAIAASQQFSGIPRMRYLGLIERDQWTVAQWLESLSPPALPKTRRCGWNRSVPLRPHRRDHPRYHTDRTLLELVWGGPALAVLYRVAEASGTLASGGVVDLGGLYRVGDDRLCGRDHPLATSETVLQRYHLAVCWHDAMASCAGACRRRAPAHMDCQRLSVGESREVDRGPVARPRLIGALRGH